MMPVFLKPPPFPLVRNAKCIVSQVYQLNVYRPLDLYLCKIQCSHPMPCRPNQYARMRDQRNLNRSHPIPYPDLLVGAGDLVSVDGIIGVASAHANIETAARAPGHRVDRDCK